MTKSRDSFIFYRSFFESTLPLNKEQKVELFDAICNYALDGKLIEINGIAKGFFTLIKPQLDANRKKWVNGCKEKSKKEVSEEQEESKTEANYKQTRSKPEGNVNVNVECKSESKLEIIIPKPKGFTPPTLEEVKNYCQERSNNVDANKFLNFYESKGWMVGKSKMKDWKASIRTWEGSTKQNFSENNNNLSQFKHLLNGK